MKEDYYQRILKERIENANIVYGYNPRKVRRGLHDKYYELVYEVIDEILNEDDPISAREIVSMLRGSLKIGSYNPGILSKLNEKFGKKYGIKTIIVEDAVRKEYHHLYEGRIRGHNNLRPSSTIFYKSMEKLSDYIKKNTSLEEIVIKVSLSGGTRIKFN